MERKFRSVQFKPKRIKVLYNWDVEQDQVVALNHVVTERKGDEKILASLKCWFAGPFTEKLDELSERVQRTLITEESLFWICGVIDATIMLEGSKQVIDEVLDFRQKYYQDVAYFDEAISRCLDPWLAKFGVKR
jgi:hypothetical protein